LVILLADEGLRTVAFALLLVYAGALAASGIHAAVRFRSLAVGLLEPIAVVVSQAVYAGGFVLGAMELRSRR
jgi:hypothetical protein